MRSTRRLRPLILLAGILLLAPAGAATAAAQEAAGSDNTASGDARSGAGALVRYDLNTYSGTPPLLELTVTEAAKPPTRIAARSGGTTFEFTVPMPTDSAGALPFTIPFSPFRRPGVHDLEVTFAGEDWEERAEFVVGFVDFEWGRDNFRFGNNPDYRELLDPYSVMLSAWLADRFEGVSDLDRALLTDYMYELFGKNAGRCYAFAGSQLRYYRRPDLLPSYYAGVYDVRARNRRLQREMNYLQMDMVFDHFVAGSVPRHPPEGPDPEALRAAVEEVLRRISSGEPAVLGLIAEDLHHAMLVYGVVEHSGTGTIDLIAANNWKDGQSVNMHSENADTLRLHVAPEHEGERVEWWNRSGERTRTPDLIYVAEVRHEYDHDPELLRDLVARRLEELGDAGEAALVVESADAAFLENGDGETTGHHDPVTRRGIEEVTFRRVQSSYLFRLPADGAFDLHVEHAEGARIYYVAPGSREERGVPREPTATILELEAPEGADAPAVRLFRVDAGKLRRGEVQPVD
ncbi:MAG: hypothetical protein ACLFO1_07610 [Spirochaetaceae bacterium]